MQPDPRGEPRAAPGTADAELARTTGDAAVATVAAAPRIVRALRRVLKPAVVIGTLSLLVVIGLYWMMALRPGTNPALVPAPPAILRALVDELASGDLLVNAAASLQRVVIGYVIGASLALVLGAVAGWFRFGGYILNPLIDALRPIPALAYIPLVIVWVGIGEPSRIIIIVLAVFKPCVVNARAGMKEVAQIYVDAARTLGASPWRVFATVAVPSAIPYFIAGLRTGVSTGFLALVAAELIAAPTGLGFMIQNAGQYFRTDITIVGIIAIGILGALLDQAASRAGRALTAWSEVRREP
ncbi:MAG TPA: ABC transporter permease [Casimicrobiaceae bacterium]|nr:ABC transporter permease [Casimicrobiaceae bacterium]